MTATQLRRHFGRRRESHTVIIARGDTVRHFTVRPWLVSALVAATAVGGGALAWPTSPLAVAQLWSAAPSPALADAYELRIATLRSEVERLTTRSFMDQERVSSKVNVLLEQQADLAERYAQLEPLLARARSDGLFEADDQPVPVPTKPDRRDASVVPALGFAAETDARKTLSRFDLVDGGAGPPSPATAPPSPDLIREIGRRIDAAESGQIAGVGVLTRRAKEKSEAIGTVLRTEGIGVVRKPAPVPGEGGPFEPVPPDRRFDASLAELAGALDDLQRMRDATTALPLSAPLHTQTVSSPFGVRSDPFLGQAAMHTGIDFVSEPGTPVSVTAGGRVTFAGENGGYGRMVEIEHGNGLSTRYAHLSAILVSVGDTVRIGETVGRVGSTGRSTGAHLHYEVRRTGEAVDPARFLRAGRRIGALG